MVEDQLARSIVEKILREQKLLSNKRVLVIAVGGWMQVLRFAYDTVRSNLALQTTKILIILDKDIESNVASFIRKEKIRFSISPNYLPVKSLEKYLLENLVLNVNKNLFRELNDYIFQGKSLDDIVKEYSIQIKNGKIKNDNNGKIFYSMLRTELSNICKIDDDLIAYVIEYLFNSNDNNIQELVKFLNQNI